MRYLFAFVFVLTACSESESDSSTDAGGSPSSETGGGGNADPECTLRDDTGGPGQYTDSCVQRSFIADYAGTYVSDTCELTIDVSGSVPATFQIVIQGDTLAGSYEIDWEGGGSGAGNDSYYRFTTDATFSTTKTLNFNAGQAAEGGEDNVSLRVENIDTGSPTFTGRYSQIRNGAVTDVDCGAYTKQD